MGHNDCFARKIFCQLLAQPSFSRVVFRDDIVGPQAPVIRIGSDVFEITHPLPGHAYCRHLISSGTEISPGGGTENSEIFEYQCLVLQDMDVASGGAFHFLKRAVEVAVVELMISAHVHDSAIESLISPSDAPSLFINVPG